MKNKMKNHQLLRREQHKKLGAKLFNHTWDLMEKKNRSMEDDAEMIRDAHASRFHWGEVGTPKNFLVGEWQIARVYSLLKMSEPAIYHAKRALAYAKARGEGLEDFHLPSAYEGLARAYAAAGNAKIATEHLARAKRLAQKIKDPDDRKIIEQQISSVRIAKKSR